MLLIIDNYDSFTYNLVQYLGEIYSDIQVYRNDRITVERIRDLAPEGIVISPGPCTPKEAGISVEVVRQLGPTIPLLGVCLGHQSIGAAFGGNIIRAPYLMHGKVSSIHHDGKGVFTNLPSPFIATRYHSLVIERDGCPDCLGIVAETEDKIIMGVRHKEYPIEGIQFHPESILTEAGKDLLRNFVKSFGGL
ncbi:MAG: anthranilate/aminodeoxychorismate synthase component II [Chitinivibrionales bacterium]|nr:anthranilate/aminodeoxychorismate synthase component II [Chitinivibrionales bacterium]MBD3356061.1 anthranilate/aminodeoxychorismate synthase component II [Chitinivibrionales bacterium]